MILYERFKFIDFVKIYEECIRKGVILVFEDEFLVLKFVNKLELFLIF